MISTEPGKRKAVARSLSLNRPLIVSFIVLLAFSPHIFYLSILYLHGQKDTVTLDGQKDAPTLDGQEKKIDAIFVISLQGTSSADKRNEGRLDMFKENWAQSCGSAPQIHHCPGVSDFRRGYGLTSSWRLCLEKAKSMDLETVVIFEDDARLFDRANSLIFCDAGKRQELIWSHLPADTFLLFLGGHTWTYRNAGEVENTKNSLHPVQFRETSRSYGTYGFAVPRRSLDLLLATIRSDIAHGFVDEKGERHQTFLSPERSWYRTARDLKKKIYAIHPLTVWHEGGFSNTWHRRRGKITGEESGQDSGRIRGAARIVDV